MAKLVFRLRNVDQDEADEVRQALEEQDIPYFETDAGNWGISMPGIWVQDDDDKLRARTAIESCQAERLRRLRTQHPEPTESVESPRERLRRWLFNLLYIAFGLVILYFSTIPFLKFLH